MLSYSWGMTSNKCGCEAQTPSLVPPIEASPLFIYSHFGRLSGKVRRPCHNLGSGMGNAESMHSIPNSAFGREDETFYRSDCEIDRPCDRGRRHSRASALDPDRSNRRPAPRAILFPPGLDRRGLRFRDLDDRHHPDLLAATWPEKAVEHRGRRRTETLTTSRTGLHAFFPGRDGKFAWPATSGWGKTRLPSIIISLVGRGFFVPGRATREA